MTPPILHLLPRPPVGRLTVLLCALWGAPVDVRLSSAAEDARSAVPSAKESSAPTVRLAERPESAAPPSAAGENGRGFVEPQVPHQDADPQAIEAALRRDVSALASDSFQGRQAGTRGGHAAAAYLVSELKRAGLRPAGDSGQWYQEFGPEYRNVLATIPGADGASGEPSRQTIVLGAHFDHVGLGNSANSQGPIGQIHNGADDNSSGTAILLTLARQLAAGDPLPRPVLIAFWDAEEINLLGSAHWVAQRRQRAAASVEAGQTSSAGRAHLYINLDMLGRLRNETLNVSCWRSASGLRDLATHANRSQRLKLKFEPRVRADSDHWSFYSDRTPTLNFDTGLHEDYHRPSDDAHKLDYAGMTRLTLFLRELVVHAAQQESPYRFRSEAFQEPGPPLPAPNQRASADPLQNRLGLIVAANDPSPRVLTILGILPETPAQRAGLLPGGRLLRLGRWRGGQLDDLRFDLQGATAPLDAEYIAPGQQRARRLQLDPAGRPVRLGISVTDDAALARGVWITDVRPNSPASRAGVRRGDVLHSIGGRPVDEPGQLTEVVAAAATPYDLVLERMGRRLKVVAEPPATTDAPVADSGAPGNGPTESANPAPSGSDR